MDNWSLLSLDEKQAFYRLANSMNVPVRQISGYNAFIAEKSAEYRRKRASQKDVVNTESLSPFLEFSHLWNHLSQEEKQQYNEKSKEMMLAKFQFKKRNHAGYTMFLKMVYPILRDQHLFTSHLDLLNRVHQYWRLIPSSQKELYKYVESRMKTDVDGRRPLVYASFYTFVMQCYPLVSFRNPNWNHVDIMKYLGMTWQEMEAFEKEVCLLFLTCSCISWIRFSIRKRWFGGGLSFVKAQARKNNRFIRLVF